MFKLKEREQEHDIIDDTLAEISTIQKSDSADNSIDYELDDEYNEVFKVETVPQDQTTVASVANTIDTSSN